MPEFPTGPAAALQIEAAIQTRKVSNATARICQLRDTAGALDWFTDRWGSAGDYPGEAMRAAVLAVKKELLYNLGIVATGVPAMLDAAERAEGELRDLEAKVRDMRQDPTRFPHGG